MAGRGSARWVAGVSTRVAPRAAERQASGDAAAASPHRHEACGEPFRDTVAHVRAVAASILGYAPFSRSARYSSICASGTRSCAIESRSRTVTALSSSESKSTVTHSGVPISSWRR